MGNRHAGRAISARRVLFCTVAGSAMVAPSAAWAQDDQAKATAQATAEAAAADAAATANQSSSAGNQIVVTATKREQTLQDVPVAVTVTTADTIERGQIRDLKDLQTVVPSLSVGQRQSSAQTNFFIRGFGNGANNPGIEPSVGVFVDNVYRSRTASQIMDLPDVQRIEVLRGPQSTLFGKNASAGVISITTMMPSFDFGGSAELTAGNYNAWVGKAYVTGPISKDIAVSVAAGINKRDGFFKDLGTGHRENERNRYFARGQMLYDPGTDITIRLIADYSHINENCCAVVNLQSSAATNAILGLGGMVNAPADKFDDVVYNNFDSLNKVKDYGGSAQVDWDVGGAKLTSISAYRGTRSITNQDPDFTSADLVYPFYQNTNVGTFTQELRLTADIADRAHLLLGGFFINEEISQRGLLTYGSQFRPYANLLIQGATGGALNVSTLETTFGALEGNPTKYVGQFFAIGQGFHEHYDLHSQAASAFGQVDFEVTHGLTLTLGGNYTDDHKRFFTDVTSTDVFSNVNFDAPQYAPFRRQLLFAGGLQQAGVNPNDPLAIAAFMNNPATAPIFNAIATYAATHASDPAVNPLNGLRALQFLPPFQNVPNPVEPGRTHDNKFTYTLRLAYDLNEQFNIYATYATGFKASSINLSRDSRPTAIDRQALIQQGLAVNNLTIGSRLAGPENARTIEGGVKANLGWLSANLAVFDEQIKGFQSNIFNGVGFSLLNAGKESVKGFEFESLVKPIPALTLNFAVTYLDPKYDKFVASSVGDLSGTTPAGIPKWNILVGAEFAYPVGNGTIVPRVSYLFQSDTQLLEGLPSFAVRNPDGSIADAGPALAAAVPFRRELNDLTASLGWEMDNGVTIEVWGRNLLNDRNIETIFPAVAQPLAISGYPNDPRTYGVTGRFKW